MSLESKVSIVGCVYLTAVLTYEIFLKFYSSPGGITAQTYIQVPFILIFLLAAVGVWRKPKAGFVTSVAINLLWLFGISSGYPNFGIGQVLSLEGVLAGGATTIGVIFVTLFFSLFGARAAFAKPRPAGAPSFRLGRTGVAGATIFLMIFIAFGEVYGSTQTYGTTNTGQADVVIALGAGYVTSSQFYVPASVQVTVGHTVTWKNLDNTPHTVTSDTGAFASGDIAVGASWSHTFTQPGTYYYICDYHFWMTGVIVVVSA